MKKFHFYDVCAPDYFRGHTCPVFAIEVDNTTTGLNVLQALKSEYREVTDLYDDISEIEFNDAFSALEQYYGENNLLDKVLFPDLPETTDFEDKAYMYFIFGELQQQGSFNYIV